jgi:Cdc6-like AAA superfamily ATPase
MAGKYNPFRPDKTAPPGIFAGRTDEIDYIQGCLNQARNGNPKHFLVTGERGIGKSSLILLMQLIARGKVTLDGGRPFNFIVVNIKLRKEDSFIAIVERAARTLKKELDKQEAFAAFVFKSIEFLSKLEVGGVRYHGEVAAYRNEALASFLDDLEEAVLKMGDMNDGILLLMDEADAPPPEADLGVFCKLLTEEMASRQTDRVCIGLAGLPHITSRLRESHESSLRLFHTLALKPLEPPERAQVLQMGLDEANNKNDKAVNMDEAAATLISGFSEGYPHFLQEFAYCAFEKDDDNIIDRKDFLESLFSENGAFDQLGVKYFNKPYNTPGSDDYRKVLHAMAENLDGWVSRAEIIQESGLKGATVDNALRALKQKDIIVQHEAKAGRYRLPTRSFATWINIQKKADAEA